MNRLRAARRRNDDNDDDREAATVTFTRPIARNARTFDLADYLEHESDRHAYEARLRRLWHRVFTPRRFLKIFRHPCYTPSFHAAVKRALAADPRLRRLSPSTGQPRYEHAPGASLDLPTTNHLHHRGHVHDPSGTDGGATA